MRREELRVGVTGHRFLAEWARVAAGVEEALGRVAESFRGRRLAVLSSLAEGADRLVAQRALARGGGARLVAVLPMPADAYAADFETEGSRAEFRELLARADEVVTLPARAARADCYAAAGRYIVSRADVLLAVWDGGAEQGRGGTGEFVRLARAAGKPLARVHAGNRRPGTREPTSLGPEQGRVTLEGFAAE